MSTYEQETFFDNYRELEVFYERARIVQETLETADEDQAREIKVDFIDDLNESYPYIGQPVITRGKGIFPLADEDGIIHDISAGEIEQAGGLHHGLHIVQISDGETLKHRLMHKILVGTQETEPLPVLENKLSIYHFMELDALIWPMIDLEEPFASCLSMDFETQQKLDAIYKKSIGLISLLSSTGFRRLKHKKQIKTIDNYLIEADSSIQVKNLEVIAEPAYAYAPFFESGNRAFIPLDVGRAVLIGTCLGLDSIEAARIRGKAVRRDADLGDKDAGICIVIDPDEDTKSGLNLREEQVLYIPTASQSFDITFYRD